MAPSNWELLKRLTSNKNFEKTYQHELNKLTHIVKSSPWAPQAESNIKFIEANYKKLVQSVNKIDHQVKNEIEKSLKQLQKTKITWMETLATYKAKLMDQKQKLTENIPQTVKETVSKAVPKKAAKKKAAVKAAPKAAPKAEKAPKAKKMAPKAKPAAKKVSKVKAKAAKAPAKKTAGRKKKANK